MTIGRAFQFVTRVVMSTLVPLSGSTLPAGQHVAPSAATIDQPKLRDVQQETMAATDGTPFVTTRANVSVPE
jgi:hypothetical protein